jgi:hypothetical protein
MFMFREHTKKMNKRYIFLLIVKYDKKQKHIASIIQSSVVK